MSASDSNDEKTPFGPEAKPWIETVAKTALDNGKVSPPAGIPSPEHYKAPDDTSVHTFQVPSTGLTTEQHAAALALIRNHHKEKEKFFLGFQANQDFPHLVGLEDYLQCQLNNLGDPFREGSFALNTKWLERSVLDYYASLWNARWPHDSNDPESYWGYVLSMGSTEGNLYGLWNAREYLSGGALLEDPAAEEKARRASLHDDRPHAVPHRLIYSEPGPGAHPNAYKPIIFYSQDTHYSIQKAVRALKITTFTEVGNSFYPWQNPLESGSPWPEAVPSIDGEEGPGSIDIDALATLVDFFAGQGHPILVFFNYGTTFKGAYDDVEAAGRRLIPILKRHGLYEREVQTPHPSVRNGFWFHVDGALGAAYMPFVEMAHNAGRLPGQGPKFDFRLPFVHSIAMSGHKWIGAPWPCGIYMTKTKLQLKPPSRPEYVGAPDTTFAGSRNGFSALLLWSFIAQNSYDRQIDQIVQAEELAAYVYQQLRELQRTIKQPLWVERTWPCTLTIRFKAPSKEIQAKYSLSGDTLYVNGHKRDYCHLFLMPHVTRRHLDALIHDLGQPGAIPDQGEAEEG
jgi:histidine decarboxylase